MPIDGSAPTPTLESVRLALADGAGTTLQVARFDRELFSAPRRRDRPLLDAAALVR